jgi:hypothetical protein
MPLPRKPGHPRSSSVLSACGVRDASGLIPGIAERVELRRAAGVDGAMDGAALATDSPVLFPRPVKLIIW